MARMSLAWIVIALGLASCALPSRTADEQARARLAALAPPARQPWADDGPADPGSVSTATAPAPGAAPADAPLPAGADDPVLQRLIDQALRDNHGVREARLRLESARMEHGLAARRLWPTPGVDVEQRWRRGGATGAGRGRDTQRAASLRLDQPLDVGGELSLRAEAAHAQVVALDFARADAERRLVADVGAAYWRVAYWHREAALCEAQRRAALALATLADARHRLGEAGGDAVAQAARQVAARRGACAAIAHEQAAARHALNRLLAVADAAAPPLAAPPVLPEADRLPAIDAGLPADLLSRRPDLRAHEWRLRQALRETYATRASFYPKITLTGQLGTASDDLLQWIQRPVASLVARLSLPFLEWRVRRWRVGAARAQADLALNAFARALHDALREVEDALSTRRRHLAEIAATRERLAAASRETAIAGARYRSGETDSAPWLERQIAQRDVASTLLRLRYDLAVNAVTLRQALGGGAMPRLDLDQ